MGYMGNITRISNFAWTCLDQAGLPEEPAASRALKTPTRTAVRQIAVSAADIMCGDVAPELAADRRGRGDRVDGRSRTPTTSDVGVTRFATLKQ